MTPPTVSEDGHIRLIRSVSFASWILSALLVYISSLLPLFDSSPRVVLNEHQSWITLAARPLLRWDSFHFAHIARSGHMYEYEWAFLPGPPLLMRGVARLLQILDQRRPFPAQAASWEYVLLGGTLAACFCGTASTLYYLTLHHFRSRSFSLLTSLLSLLPSSPGTLRLSGYSEPFFTYLSYKGMLYCTSSDWFLATWCFALAGLFRSNGVMLGGFIIWGLLIEPFLAKEKISASRLAYTIALTSAIFTPFIAHQFSAYQSFCVPAITPAPWCSYFPPAIYSYVQKEYWNVGFLRYWTMQQLPNFLICAPVLLLLLVYSTHYIHVAFFPRVRAFLSPPPRTKTSPFSPPDSSSDASATKSTLFFPPSLAPHAIHALLFTILILFNAHTQIILRLAASIPFTYWGAAWLLVKHPRWGRCWIVWSVVWGAVSLVLWATFLPPA
ncbi:glycosyltransferase family 76 protein [Wolfiporia cocos MD-104 SS10]|uniref:GPI mannosyltransferase 2 n=1 Tax=Wolfiporia cocos (strain MD-104) TaxID=742152 RepID=A0A2H3K4Y3_WOLCO|nr:glycosyltransferase family 76 protein [Wolfiporia cocos MD-104 SS10]